MKIGWREFLKRMNGNWLALEDIYAMLNGGKYDKFFLDRIRTDSDGQRHGLTKKGEKIHSKLVNLLYACSKVSCIGVDDIVDELDNIADGEAC